MKQLFEYLISKKNKKNIYTDPNKYYDDLMNWWEESIENEFGKHSYEEFVNDETGDIEDCIYVPAKNILELVGSISDKDIQKNIEYETGEEYNRRKGTLGGRLWFAFIPMCDLLIKKGKNPKKVLKDWLKILFQ